MKRLAITLRTKIVIFGMILLILPNLAYLFLSNTHDYLLAGQRQTVVNSANTIATMLHERPELFSGQTQGILNLQQPNNLQIVALDSPVRLDGQFDDWTNTPPIWKRYASDSIIEQALVYRTNSLSFEHALGKYQGAIYAAFDVTDDNLLFRPQTSLRVDRNDFLLLAMTNAAGALKRYILAPFEPGWVNAYLLDQSTDSYVPVSLETRIQGQWRITENGYSVELRFPESMLNNQLAFAVGDVDDSQSRRLNYLIGTSNPTDTNNLSAVVNSAPALEKTLQSLQYADARISILDRGKRVLTVKGSVDAPQALPLETSQRWVATVNQWLLPLYDLFLPPIETSFVDDWQDSYEIESTIVDLALNGNSGIISRNTSQPTTDILVAAHPIFVEDDVMAVVLVEQSTLYTQRIVRSALEYQITAVIICLLLGSILLWFFASGIANRIRKLRNSTEAAIDNSGKIVRSITPSNSSDEIGDLSRSFHSVLEKLTQYNQYLENMASRLSHELRTPVAIVNSSLENMELDADNHSTYVERAKQGISRLSRILQSMSEATRLEEIIQTADIESFDVANLLISCIEGYRMTHTQHDFALDLTIENKQIKGSADLFVQMLDKIIANAVEFSEHNATIRIRAFEKQNQTCLSITNPGPLLPDNMRHQLLSSMVSVREKNIDASSHLGLGLFIADMIAKFHHGKLEIENLPDHSGVIVILTF